MRGGRSYHEFQRQLSAGKLASGYIFIGSEDYLITEALNALRAALITEDFTTLAHLPVEADKVLVNETMFELFCRDPAVAPRLMPVAGAAQEAKLRTAQQAIEAFDYFSCQGRDVEPEQVLLAIRSAPVLVRRKLIVVRDFDRYRKEAQEQLLTELVKESTACRIVLTAESPGAVTERLITDCGAARFVYAANPANPNELLQFIDRWAERAHLKLSADARQMLFETCGDSLGQLRSELEKLQTFLGATGDTPLPVTKELVRNLGGRWREYDINEFVDAVALRNPQQALTSLRHLMDWNEEPVKIVGWLAGRFLRLLSSDSRLTQPWSRAEIVRALRYLARIDLKLKSGYPERYYLLEGFVARTVAPRTTIRR